ncbi:hypothetical protein CBS63078_10553 [Aspergillus niger]|nr:hypothetical protein CBS115989_10751 [Aspergillus niger]KAI2823746.1 hypothetical protein CBS133816_9035 [Aspergillus niger]KAI2836578.1 hypothetical protein CBS11232_10157 [Aspergillus niger]KAI2843634.1 hypothetical protein CBS11350_5123 [Aspergillus niger]KAI2864818.1 hypothetical protein CBS13152_11150 [Aspergillus niger]
MSAFIRYKNPANSWIKGLISEDNVGAQEHPNQNDLECGGYVNGLGESRQLIADAPPKGDRDRALDSPSTKPVRQPRD